MYLLIDVGNTNLNWGLHDGNAITETGLVAMNQFADSGLSNICTGTASIQQVAAATVSNDALIEKLCALTKTRFGVNLELVATQSEFLGVRCAYEDPRQLGVDRWAAIVAAWHQHGKPVVVVDCGTAITVDAVDESGNHLGGWITPGPSLMQQSLVQNASRIPAGAGVFQIGPATGTADAVFSGSVLAAIGFIDNAINKLQSSGKQFECIITGGDAIFLQQHLTAKFDHQPHLVLEGVRLLAGESK